MTLKIIWRHIQKQQNIGVGSVGSIFGTTRACRGIGQRNILNKTCADPERFARGGPNLITYIFFKVNEEIEDPNIKVNGPSSTRQRNAI